MLTRTIIYCLLIMSSFNVLADAQFDKDYTQALGKWSNVLNTYVDNQGRTDFISLAENLDDLQSFVDFIGTTSPKSNPEFFPTKEDVLAYHINTYNALAMYGVIERKIPKALDSFFKRASFFKFRKIIIGNKKTSLYDYENKVIRALDEPRIHFALNCMVKDCPRLPQEPFLAETLEQQLDAATKEFFTKSKHYYLVEEKQEVYFSWILDYYSKDFVTSGKRKDLITYADRYLETPIPQGYKVKVIKYDWTINQQPK